MDDGKTWENPFWAMEVPYIVLDAQSSSVRGTVDPVHFFWVADNLWYKPNRYRVYHVHRNEVMTTKEFINLPSISGHDVAFLIRKSNNNGLQIVWRHYMFNSIRYDDVPEEFAEQYVGAYLFDSDNAEDRKRFMPQEDGDQKEREEKESLQELLDRGKRAIPEQLLKELRESVERHCQLLGKLSVAKLRQLVKTVTEASQIDQEMKDRILVGCQKWNKRALCNWLSYQGEVKIDKVPMRFLDPIWMHIMLDPVVLPNGTTIDRKSYADIMSPQGSKKNPYTQEPLDPSYKPPSNLFAKDEITKFIAEYAIDTEDFVSEDV